MKKHRPKAAVGVLALVLAGAANAQSMAHMPGMKMPMPAAKPAARKPQPKKAAARKPSKARPSATKPVAGKPAPRKTPVAPRPAAAPVEHGHTEMSGMDMAQSPAPPTGAGHQQAIDHQMDMSQPEMASISAMDHGPAGHMAMRGALGTYGSTREASGTAWQPDSSQHRGYMRQAGDWMLMLHGNLDLVADSQGSRRGDSRIFPAGMVMAMATRSFASGNALQFKAMLSPDPLMGKSGYPLLLASGETADGETRLIDRQHPHDLFMELSGSYSVKLSEKSSAFVYGGLPGEPAFGPPAFMHRQSIMVSPEAPITHHWLDSTHITFGVVTAGLVLDEVKLEASRFNAREPDQHRYNIETGPLDSTSLRLSWNPTRDISLQGSWAHLTEPEQLEPGVDQRRWSASAIYTRPTANGWWSSTLAWGRKTIDGRRQDAFALESSIKRDSWTLFGRGELAENNELVPGLDHGPVYRVGKASLGLARDVDLAGPFSVTLGALGSVNFIPSPLADAYGKKHPPGAMAFLRFKVD